MAIVLKPFPYSKNGIDTEQLAPGDEREFGPLTDGLVAEGFVDNEPQKSDVGKETKVDEVRESAVAPTKNKPRNRK